MNVPLLPTLPRVDTTHPMCDKTRYPSKRDAITAINARTHGHQRKRPAHLRAYPCPRCRGWHLTHNENDEPRT